MKLIAKDQIHISGVSSDTLRPGQEIDVSDERGAEILRSLPDSFEQAAEKVRPETKRRGRRKSLALSTGIRGTHGPRHF